MAKYYGTYSCGHKGYINIGGPEKDRQWKADRHFEGPCDECKTKAKQSRREEENRKNMEQAAELNKEYGMPLLEGSEKQIAWANTIRQKLIDEFGEEVTENHLEYAKDNYGDFYDGLNELDIKQAQEIAESIIRTKNRAKYYIDRRSENVWYYISEDYTKRKEEKK